MKSGDTDVFKTELIYCRVMCLLTIGRITPDDVPKHELSLISLSFFENAGEMRALKSKSDLKIALQVETSLCLQPNPTVVMIDGCAKTLDYIINN